MATTTISQAPVAAQAIVIHFYADGSMMAESEKTPNLLYKVEFNVELGHFTCGCPDHQYRGRACKHIQRAIEVLESSSLSQLTTGQKNEWYASYSDPTRRAHRAASISAPVVKMLETLFA